MMIAFAATHVITPHSARRQRVLGKGIMIFHAEKPTLSALPFVVMLKIVDKFHHGMINQIGIVQLKNHRLAVLQIG